MNVIIDTREQLPFDFAPAIRKKLDVGDYTTEILEGVFHIERKSPGDLYGSIVGSHKRFRNMLVRAQEMNIQLVVVIECSEQEFYGKRWSGGYRCKVKGNVLAKIVKTMREKYCEFIFCADREQAEQTTKNLLKAYEV